MLPQKGNFYSHHKSINSGGSGGDPSNEEKSCVREGRHAVKLTTGISVSFASSVGAQTFDTFHSACSAGNIDRVKFLLESGVLGDVNSELCGFHDEANGKLTPLCCAVFLGNHEVIQVLISNYGADVNRCSAGRRTPLHFAVARDSNAACVAALLTAGADPNLTDNNGRTPLHDCVSKSDTRTAGVIECVRLFIEDGRVNLNAQDHHGYTALYLSAMNEHSKCCEMLVGHGSDVTVKNSDGTTPLSMLVRKLPEVVNRFVDRLDSGVTLQNCDSAGVNCEIKMDFSVLIPPSSSGNCYKKRSHKNGMKKKGSKNKENGIVNGSGERFLVDDKRKPRETTLLTCLVSTGNKKLLSHPLSEAFLLLKWRRVRKFFLASLVFQMALVALLTIYVVEVYLIRCPYKRPDTQDRKTSVIATTPHTISKRSPYPYPDSEFHWFQLKPPKKKAPTTAPPFAISMEDYLPHAPSTVTPPSALERPDDDISNKELLPVPDCRLIWPLQVIRVLLLVTVAILCFQEVFQFVHKPTKYVVSTENWVQWLLMASVLVTIWTNNPGKLEFQLEYWQYPAAAFGILIAWALSLFQVGRFPSFGIYMEMFGKVATDFGLFILAYACLLIAFALSFCVLFPDHPPFSSVPLSILKVLTMMVGEVDYEDLFYSEERSNDPILFPITAHLLFGAFVLIMTIVLMNLLVGLAVSDIQGLQKGARLDRLCRQTALIARFESFIFSRKLGTVVPAYFVRLIQENSSLAGSSSPANASQSQPQHEKNYGLSISFRPNDANDRILPMDIKQAALTLVSSTSRRLHGFQPRQSQCQSCKQTALMHMRKSDHSLECGNEIPNNFHHENDRLDQLEAKLVNLEKGIEKILETLVKTGIGKPNKTQVLDKMLKKPLRK